MNLPASPSGRAARDVVLAAMFLMLCRVVPVHCLAEATGAGAHISNSGARVSLAADPVVDGAYVQAQLAYLVTRDPRREAGQDTDLPRTRNGHDEFAADWLAILRGVARAMAPLWRLRRPARTVAFVLFDGEEQGLIGSVYYARVYRHGAPYRIVALYNEEQNGVGYPIRPFGLATNPILPEHVFVTPQRHGSRWAPPAAPRFWPALRRFTAALARARGRAFATLHAVYPQLSYRPAISAPVFRPADEHLVPIGDDTIGGSDEVPFEHLGLPTATFVSNYDYHARRHHPWSYPYDTARDTMALLERTAAGAAQPSSALAAALALPGQLTVEMLRDRAWGSDVGLV